MTPALETRHLNKYFGAFTVTNDVSLTLAKGARHALIGPNGAGKTTLINLLTGALSPSSGQIMLAGEDITQTSIHGRVQRGMARTFQINQLFADLTPLESLLIALNQRRGDGARLWKSLSSYRETSDEAASLLEQFRLIDVMDEPSQRLPYGKQRLLEIALAIAMRPKVLLLDEPAAGVPEDERHEVLGIVRNLPDDVTIVLIEHDMELVFSFADQISVLAAGQVIAQGSVADISTDPHVKAIYLGADAT
ncbi:branched-chain amino acid transport system ATP-binding protein [Agrobacterium vitis]|nr:branched-chain amino acid transport system ATP-binding protein [Agrobacterium vitis]MBE1436605.1 branched-chain amino acid transport system ATP-binding protein [Agrobacterium vitis]